VPTSSGKTQAMLCHHAKQLLVPAFSLLMAMEQQCTTHNSNCPVSLLLQSCAGSSSISHHHHHLHDSSHSQNKQINHLVAHCVEQELPPNSVHCLHLLLVLELQHIAVTSAAMAAASSLNMVPIAPASAHQTHHVAQLLCCLCEQGGPSLSEPLCPHLFGLLAFSASYPVLAIHIAQATLQMIMALAEHCLTLHLVWLIHDCKMIIHMMDDVKDLSKLAATPLLGTGLMADDASNCP